MKLWSVHTICLTTDEFIGSNVFIAPGDDEFDAFTKVMLGHDTSGLLFYFEPLGPLISGTDRMYMGALFRLEGPELDSSYIMVARVEFKEDFIWWEDPEVRAQVLDGTYEGIFVKLVK